LLAFVPYPAVGLDLNIHRDDIAGFQLLFLAVGLKGGRALYSRFRRNNNQQGKPRMYPQRFKTGACSVSPLRYFAVAARAGLEYVKYDLYFLINAGISAIRGSGFSATSLRSSPWWNLPESRTCESAFASSVTSSS
jgi:hypothetical protein